MTRHILIQIQDDDVTRQYLESMRYLNHLFHNHPTCLKKIPVLELGDYNYDVHERNQRRERPERMIVR
jgi:hypothetical protein